MEDINQYYIYVSTRACYDPAKTIFVCAPGEEAGDLASAERFARRSGWQALAEYDGAVLIVPLAPKGWAAEQTSLPGKIFDSVRGAAESRNGKSLMGREGKLWCWETLIYLVGYGDGAVFAGNCVVAEPNRFAATVLIGGAPNDYSAGARPSSHWLVRNVTSDYAVRNDQIPSSLWLLGAPAEDARRAVDYFAAVDGFEQAPKQIAMGELQVCCYQNEANPAQRLMLSEQPMLAGLSLAHIILEEYFEHTIRWKDGPDGTLRLHLGRTGFYTNPRFIHRSVIVSCLEYAYSVHLPDELSLSEVQGLPILFSVHGRGEPAWLFAEKNGWDVLADKTRAFVLICPDSPGNIWQFKRDGHAFGAMIDKLYADYGLDRTRVYLTGFSNGGSIIREVGSAYPQLFAGISPYNAPVHVPGIVMGDAISPQLLPSGYELPYWVYVGDNDPAAGLDVDEQLEIMLAVNHCAKRPAQGLTTRFAPDEVRTGKGYYTVARGYTEGDRFQTLVYHGSDGIPRVGYTIMKNMPHGAICEQSLATWEFLRHFRRPAGSRQVEYLP
jgi:poly(3-hydroxybutyrate) depolymerase